MNHSVLAPQFGLRHSAPADANVFFDHAPQLPAPTVVIKKKRILPAVETPPTHCLEVQPDGLQTSGADMPADVGTEASAEPAVAEPAETVEQRAPRVFRVQAADPPGSSVDDEAPEQQAQAEDPGAPACLDAPETPVSDAAPVPDNAAGSPTVKRLHRRRRDPLRAPTLVRHVVFDQPQAQTTPAEAPVSAAQSARFELHLPTDGGGSQYLAVQQALDRLREDVARAQKGRRVLDELTATLREFEAG